MLDEVQKSNILDSVQLARAVVEANKEGQFNGMLPDLQTDVCKALLDMVDELLRLEKVSLSLESFGEVAARA
jgi:hypothetical protein